MNLTRRTFVGAAAAATTLIAKPAILFAAEPLVVGYVPGNAIHWIQSVCLEKGFYKEAGFDAKGATMQNSPQAMQSLISGGYQLATTQPEPLAAAWAHGAKNVAAIAAPMNAADWILSGKKGVNKLTDLKGQVIGVSSLRTSEVWLTTRLLEKAGLKKGEFNFIQSGVSPLKVAALLKGSIGAAVLFRPSADVAETQGLAGLAKYADLRAYPPILYCVNRDWAAKGNAGKRAAAAIKKGHEWMWDPNNKRSRSPSSRNIPSSIPSCSNPCTTTISSKPRSTPRMEPSISTALPMRSTTWLKTGLSSPRRRRRRIWFCRQISAA